MRLTFLFMSELPLQRIENLDIIFHLDFLPLSLSFSLICISNLKCLISIAYKSYMRIAHPTNTRKKTE